MFGLEASWARSPGQASSGTRPTSAPSSTGSHDVEDGGNAHAVAAAQIAGNSWSVGPRTRRIPLCVFDAGYDPKHSLENWPISTANASTCWSDCAATRWFYADPLPAPNVWKGWAPRRHGQKFTCAEVPIVQDIAHAPAVQLFIERPCNQGRLRPDGGQCSGSCGPMPPSGRLTPSDRVGGGACAWCCPLHGRSRVDSWMSCHSPRRLGQWQAVSPRSYRPG